MSAGALAALERVLAQGEADDVLRGVVDVLVAEGGCDWAGILFVEGGDLVLGPEAGTQQAAARVSVPVNYDGERIAEVVADRCDDEPFLERVAVLISEWCLVGWDTGGAPWNPDE